MTSEYNNGVPHLEEVEDGEVEDGEIEDDTLSDAGTVDETKKAEVRYPCKVSPYSRADSIRWSYPLTRNTIHLRQPWRIVIRVFPNLQLCQMHSLREVRYIATLQFG